MLLRNQKDMSQQVIKSEDSPYKHFNINVSEDQLAAIEVQLRRQCPDLIQNSEDNNNKHDISTYSILQIGKQNHNRPILQYLVDAYNRYRIQHRKRCKRKYVDEIIFDQKFVDVEPVKFITKKCGGFNAWLREYKEAQINRFKNMCQASISVYERRFLHKPPIDPRIALINDSYFEICRYIMDIYGLIDQFAKNQTSPLPAQIDAVIIPKLFKSVNDEEVENQNDNDEKEGSDGSKVGDMGKRLENLERVLGPKEIEWDGTKRIILELINSVLSGRRNKRAIVVVDRRTDNDTDILYTFQPNKINESLPNVENNKSTKPTKKESLKPQPKKDPNINRIVNALTNSTLSEKYSENVLGFDLKDALLEFIKEEEFEDDAMAEEFGDGKRNDSLFEVWLLEHDKYEMTKEQFDKIWIDLNAAYNGKYVVTHVEKESNDNSEHTDCSGFERDESKFLYESLMQNCRTCVLPKSNESETIGINSQFVWGLLFSFHVFSSKEVRVYFGFNGWGTRFFIEDIKYFLPAFFVNGVQTARDIWTQIDEAKNKEFDNLYQKTKEKCTDEEFETFYRELLGDKNRKCH